MMYPYPSYVAPRPSYDGGVEKHILIYQNICKMQEDLFGEFEFNTFGVGVFL